MPFSHYAKIKAILSTQSKGWYIIKINETTQSKNFRGDIVRFPYYYRIYDSSGNPIKYCKFQQIDRLASVLKLPVEDLPVTN